MLLTSSGMEQELYKTHIKLWSLRVYIINGHVTGKKLYDRSYCGYFMGYSDTTGVII